MPKSNPRRFLKCVPLIVVWYTELVYRNLNTVRVVRTVQEPPTINYLPQTVETFLYYSATCTRKMK